MQAMQMSMHFTYINKVFRKIVPQGNHNDTDNDLEPCLLKGF